ncbi:MAG: hypothetical protein AD742_11120 [Methylibium sp. NZG]|nr:MAG: hypothetical protein AD742_11120 [Methylibium sp. NZG]
MWSRSSPGRRTRSSSSSEPSGRASMALSWLFGPAASKPQRAPEVAWIQCHGASGRLATGAARCGRWSPASKPWRACQVMASTPWRVPSARLADSASRTAAGHASSPLACPSGASRHTRSPCSPASSSSPGARHASASGFSRSVPCAPGGSIASRRASTTSACSRPSFTVSR